jgi:hypothetical protein
MTQLNPATPSQNRRSRTLRLLWYAFVYYLIIRPCVIILFSIPGPWGPSLSATLPLGEKVIFRCRRRGGETDELLYVDYGNKGVREYCVNCTHALGVKYARLKYAADNRSLFVESGGRVIATLELDSNTFYGENMQQPLWLMNGPVETLVEGWTRYILFELIWPL